MTENERAIFDKAAREATLEIYEKYPFETAHIYGFRLPTPDAERMENFALSNINNFKARGLNFCFYGFSSDEHKDQGGNLVDQADSLKDVHIFFCFVISSFADARRDMDLDVALYGAFESGSSVYEVEVEVVPGPPLPQVLIHNTMLEVHLKTLFRHRQCNLGAIHDCDG